LQSNNPCNKYKAKIHKDLGTLGIEFTLDRTISDFISNSARIDLDYVQSFAEFGNVLQGCLLSDWKQVVSDHFPEPVDLETVLPTHDRSSAENFSRMIDLFLTRTLNKRKPQDCQYIYMVPGGDHGIHKDLMTQPLDHLHWFQEMLQIAELLPAGDIVKPNAALQVERFYMSFHKSDHSEYVRSGHKLCDKTLTTLAQYFESTHNARVGDGLLQKKREDQIRQSACRDYHHELQSWDHDKLKHIADYQARSGWQRNRDKNFNRDNKSCERPPYRDQCKTGDKNCGGNRKTPAEGSAKKPCHVHGPDSKHSYAECRTNPKNQRSTNNNNNNYGKRAHDSHYQDNCHHSSDDKSRDAPVMSLVSSEGKVSANASTADRSHEKYHLDSYHIPKIWRLDYVPHKSPGNNALVSTESGSKKKPVQMPSQLPRSLTLTVEDIFPVDADDISMDDLFIKMIAGNGQTEEPGLDAHDGQTDAFFN
jgi:hypothetical protein